jgi:hypothetical protein
MKYLRFAPLIGAMLVVPLVGCVSALDRSSTVQSILGASSIEGGKFSFNAGPRRDLEAEARYSYDLYQVQNFWNKNCGQGRSMITQQGIEALLRANNGIITCP